MAAHPTTLSLQQFQQLPEEKPALEYWFGSIVQKPMGTRRHGYLQILLGRILYEHGLLAGSEVRLRLDAQAEPVPDLIAERKASTGAYPTEPFELAVEIRSPKQSLSWLKKKARYYVSRGIDHVWIIDPDDKTAWVFSQAVPNGERIPAEGSLTANSVMISLQRIFGELDQIAPPEN